MGSTSGIPGLLYANTKISRPDVLDEKTFFEWYDEEHIPELVGTSGFDSAFRFIDTNPDSERPHLAVYPTKDFSFFQSDEFRGMKSLQSDKLPGTGAAGEFIESMSRFDKLVQVYDPTKKGPGHTRCVITAQMKSVSGPAAEEDIDAWYREEHLRLIAKAEGYLRTTRYKLGFSAQLPPSAEDEVKPPVWLALHEFETETVDLNKLTELTITDWTKKIHETTEGNFIIYKLAKGFGTQDLFHGVEM
ncbi:Core atranone cluster (CAC) protein 1 [Apiospora arundinis]|uniref:Core atranone cluster (CAC) protein 1 n=1 Tax=Apiospora arundinis TaxID=335852 RepID=A0ABR2J967_9PEZI